MVGVCVCVCVDGWVGKCVIAWVGGSGFGYMYIVIQGVRKVDTHPPPHPHTHASTHARTHPRGCVGDGWVFGCGQARC